MHEVVLFCSLICNNDSCAHVLDSIKRELILHLFCRFTCLQAYKNLLNELGDQAGQHEMIAENLSTTVVQELSSLVKQLKDDRRKVKKKYSGSLFLRLELAALPRSHCSCMMVEGLLIETRFMATLSSYLVGRTIHLDLSNGIFSRLTFLRSYC